MNKKLYVIGQGIEPTRDITYGGLEKIRKSDLIVVISLSDGLEKIIKSVSNAEIKDITSAYYDGAKDIDNYDRYYEELIHSLNSYNSVVFIVPGHPRVGVTVVQWLQENRSNLNFEIEVDSGISSFDTMINDIAIDPLERGSMIVDANRLLLFDHTMEKSVNYFIYHVCSVGTSKTNFHDPKEGNHLNLLQKKLEETFSPEHKIALCQSSEDENSKSRVIWMSLNELNDNVNKITFSTSLYVPASNPDKLNREFLSLLRGH